MALKRSPRKVQVNPGGTTPYKSVVPDGTMSRSFIMRISPELYGRIGEVGEKMLGDWSKADVVRLALARLFSEVDGKTNVPIERYLDNKTE